MGWVSSLEARIGTNIHSIRMASLHNDLLYCEDHEMTTPDHTLAARLTELDNALGLAQAQVGGAGWAKECNALSAALLSAFCADQLITTAEADARVKAAVLAEREACAWTATSFLVGDPKNGIPLRGPMASEVAAAIRARGVTG